MTAGVNIARTLPLSKAAFVFGISSTDEPASEQQTHILKESQLLAQLESALSSAEPASKTSLKRILTEISGAQTVEIDIESCTFSFSFGRELYSGPAWTFAFPLPGQRREPDPRGEAEALFRKEGFVWTSGDQSGADARLKAVQKAASLVWNQYICHALDLAIRDTRLEVSARIGQPIAKRTPLPSEVWQVLTVVDWQNGVAASSDGTMYYDIRVADPNWLLKQTIRDEARAIKALKGLLEQNRNLSRAEAERFCKEHGLGLSSRGFKDRIWPDARVAAGLPKLASAGRKRRSQAGQSAADYSSGE